jgi:periplasmic divalent cation tolerance protein
MTTITVVTTTGSRDEAQRLAYALVERGLAACAQISEIESFYAWEGEIRNDAEYRIVFKTTDERYDDVERAIVDLHSYELPAIHAVAVERIYAPYAQWVEQCCRGEAA